MAARKRGRGRTLGYFRDRRTKKVFARARSEKREPRLDDNFRPEAVKLDALLLHMHKQDGLTDDQLPSVRKYDGSVVRLLTGKAAPSLAERRNVRMHSNPFGSGYTSGLLELVHDLIEYAYRERIREAAGRDLHQHFASEFASDFNDPQESMQEF